MYGPTWKYRGAKQDDNGTPIFWDGHPDHFPMKGQSFVPLTPDEVQASELVFNERYACFELPAQVAPYLEIKDKARNGLFVLQKEMPITDPQDPKKMYVHLWWTEIEAVARPEQAGRNRQPSASPYLPGKYW